MGTSEIRVGLLSGVSIIKLRSREGLLVKGQGLSLSCNELEILTDEIFPVKRLYRVFTDDFERLEDALDAALKSDESPIRGAVEVGREIEPYAHWGYHNAGFWTFAGEFNGEEEALSFARYLEEKGGKPWIKSELRGNCPGKAKVITEKGEFEAELPLDIIPSGDKTLVLNMPVGEGFHWEHREDLHYRGSFEVLGTPGGGFYLVNRIPLEDYLKSVVSSEMGEAPLEALKAQAIAARNTLLSTLKRHHYFDPFDICATDHCQVYLGVKGENEMSSRAVEETSGEILVFDGRICDTRFAKVCGGITENFEHVWGGKGLDYLISHRDNDSDGLLLRTEEDVRNFIDVPPPSFCSDHELFRWKIRMERGKLESILKEKTGTSLELVDIVPVKRGASGRIIEIKLIGKERELIIRGELRIRNALSESHLFSSLFYVVKLGENDGLPDAFEFRGGGFGHGVGMCQIGAIGMARKGYNYHEILAHYYPGTELVKVE